MARKVTADTDQLRDSAAALKNANVERADAGVDAAGLGSRVAVSAFEEFHHYWMPARSALTGSVDALAGVLRSTAEVQEQRDAKSADDFFWGF